MLAELVHAVADIAQVGGEAAKEAAEAAKATGFSAAHLSAGIGAGMAIIGVGIGMGRIASSADEGIARPPEAAGDIRGSSIIFAAMLEGATLFAVVVALLLNFK